MSHRSPFDAHQPFSCGASRRKGGRAVAIIVLLLIACTGRKDSATTSNDGGTSSVAMPEIDAGPLQDEGGLVASPSDSGTEVAPVSEGDAAPRADAEPIDGSSCWSLPVVNRARLFPAPGRAADLANGTILGSTTSPTTDFVELGRVNAVPAAGMFTELAFAHAKPYRYVKYQGPRGSFGAIAELELYAGSVRLTGGGFGVAGSRNDGGNVYAKALDGDTDTFFEGPMPDGDYVGLDLGAGHAAASPTFAPAPGPYNAAVAVTLASPTAGASIRITTDVAHHDTSTIYSSPVLARPRTTTLKA